MASTVDLELGIHRRSADMYGINLRFAQPDDEVDVRLSCEGPTFDAFDPNSFLEHQLNMEKYGEMLAERIFADPRIQEQYQRAQTYADANYLPLRIRLFVDRSAPELHSLRWETLRTPKNALTGNTAYVTMGERVFFSRYISSADTRPVRPRPRSALRALVVVANPSNLVDFGLAPLDVVTDLTQARAGLGSDALIKELAVPGDATLNNIMAALRSEYDILYIICHGKQFHGYPVLVLEDETGAVDFIRARDFATRLRELQALPKLVVLASCGSAGSGDALQPGDASALAMLGPRLADAGVPAVIAMQGLISMETMSRFMPVFFKELRRDGVVDRAAAVARGAIRDRHDWWVPILMMRLQRGQIWYTPGFGQDRPALEQWRSLLLNFKRGGCTPILGPGLSRSFMGSRQQIAQRWAETFKYPLAPHERDDLPQVIQFVSINHGEDFARQHLEDHLVDKLQQQIAKCDVETLPPELQNRVNSDALAELTLSDLYVLAWKIASRDSPLDPYRTLAQLNAPLYVTAQHSDLLYEALVESGRQPRQEICIWRDFRDAPKSVFETEPTYRPSAEAPLVYYLFGRMKYPDTLVLSEDDYFEYLMGITANKELMPEFVRRRLVDSALLFLGFRMDSWDFRVLFHSLMQYGGGVRRRGYAHVAAQVNPEEGKILEPDRARTYLESYFFEEAIRIYWGRVEDFIAELHERAPQQFKTGA